jgi:hypothetical protein
MTLALYADFALLALLAVAIGCMALVMHRLGALRRERIEFERLLGALAAATAQTEASTQALRRGVELASDGLAKPLARAQALKDELAFLTERAERLAQTIEGAVSGERAATGPSMPRPREVPPRTERALPAAVAQLR